MYVVVVYFARSLLILPAAKTEKEKKRCELTSLSFVRSHKLYYKTAWTDFFNFSFPTCRPLFLRTWEDRTDMRRSGKKGIQWGSVNMILQIALQFSSQKRRTNMFFRYFPIVSYIFSRHTAQITEKKENSRPRRWDHLSSSLWIYPFLSIYPSRCLEPSQLDSGGGSCKNKHTHIFKSRDCDSTRFSEKVSRPPQPSVDDRNEHSWIAKRVNGKKKMKNLSVRVRLALSLEIHLIMLVGWNLPKNWLEFSSISKLSSDHESTCDIILPIISKLPQNSHILYLQLMRMLVYLRAVCITAWMSLSRYFTLSHGKFLHTLESPLSAILNRRSSKESHHHRSSKLYSICCTVYALWFRTHRTRQDESGNIPKIDWFLCVIVFSSHGSEQTTHCMHCSPDVSTGNFFVSRRHFVYFIHWNLDGEIFICFTTFFSLSPEMHNSPQPTTKTTL